MIDIEDLRKLNTVENIITTQHSVKRLLQREISILDVQKVIAEGEIIRQYEDDKPYSSCLILGLNVMGKYLHIVVSHNFENIFLITAYFPDPAIWQPNFKIKK